VTEERTLSADAAISSDTDSLADPVLGFPYVLVLSTISVLLLRFVQDRVVLGGHQCRHEDPFRDLRAVDSTGSRERNIRVFYDPMICPSVHAS
jgi:hypothetical protein